MSRDHYFRTEIGKQSLAGMLTIGSFPFLYIGGGAEEPMVTAIGLLLLLGGMLAVPIMTFLSKHRG